MLYAGLSPSSSARKRSRSCANESGRSPPSGSRTSAGRSGSPSRAAITAASPSNVGCSKIAESGTSTPNAFRTRLITWAARSEWPPSAKKSSRAPIGRRSINRPQTSASTRSVGVRGATKAAASSPPSSRGAGSRRLSTLPFGVSGKASIGTTSAGTMKSGRRFFACSRSAEPSTAFRKTT
jgi:hypothetical protein